MARWRVAALVVGLLAGLEASASAQVIPGGWAPGFGVQNFGFGGGMPGFGLGVVAPFGNNFGMVAPVPGMGVGYGGYPLYGGYDPYGPVFNPVPTGMANGLLPLSGAIEQATFPRRRR